MIAKRVKREKGASSFSRLVEYLLDAEHQPSILLQTPELYNALNQKVAWFDLAHCEGDIPAVVISEVEATQAQNIRSKNDKTYHLVVSFPVDEKPSPEVLRDIEKTLCEGIGLGEHQRLIVAHQDTENFHVHVAINKVHPETLRCVEPYYDHFKLNELCRALEAKHQLKPDNRIEMDKERENSREMEAHSGEKSLLSWLKENVRDELLACVEHANHWQDVHDLLAGYGLDIKPRGAGLVIGSPQQNVYVKASSLNRELSFKALTSKFGIFVPSNHPVEHDSQKPQYNRGPKHPHPKSHELYAQYQTQREAHCQERSESLKQLQSKHRQYAKDLKTWYDQQYKNLRYSLFLSGPDKKARYTLLAEQRRKDMASQRLHYAASKKAIMEKTRLKNWTGFLNEESKNRNTLALSILRRQEKRKTVEQLPEHEQAKRQRSNDNTMER